MMRVAELTGAYLDYWTARAEGISDQLTIRQVDGWPDLQAVHEGSRKTGSFSMGIMAYSKEWALGGPLIEKWRLDVYEISGNWYADLRRTPMFACGDTPLQAICRAVVRAAFGDEVPDINVT